jgi:CMP-N,N'-diacetyllegionaminic acid synthase
LFNGKRILAVVPARGGSKGLKLKNLRKVNGVSLIERVGRVLADIPWVDRSIVSTDHEGIGNAAISAGLEKPFVRPKELSGDRVADVDVLAHALTFVEHQDNVQYDIVRKAQHILDTVSLLTDRDFDSVWTVSPTDSKAHPLKQLCVSDERIEHYSPDGETIIARQQLEPVFHRNGVAYAVNRHLLLEEKTLKSANTGALVLEDFHVSIDTEFDISLAEFVEANLGK